MNENYERMAKMILADQDRYPNETIFVHWLGSLQECGVGDESAILKIFVDTASDILGDFGEYEMLATIASTTQILRRLHDQGTPNPRIALPIILSHLEGKSVKI